MRSELLEPLQDFPNAQLASVRVLLGDGLHLRHLAFTVSSHDNLFAVVELLYHIARLRLLVLQLLLSRLLLSSALQSCRVLGAPQLATLLHSKLLDGRLPLARPHDRVQEGLLIQPGHVYPGNILILELLLAEGLLPRQFRALPDILVHIQVILVDFLFLSAAVFREELDEAVSFRLRSSVQVRSLLQKCPGIVGVSVLIAAQLRLGRLHQETVGGVGFTIVVGEALCFMPADEVALLAVAQLRVLIHIMLPVIVVQMAEEILGR